MSLTPDTACGFDGPHPDCLCGHSLQAHRSKVFDNRVYPFCVLCPGCNGFGIIRPAVPRALLLDGEEIPRCLT